MTLSLARAAAARECGRRVCHPLEALGDAERALARPYELQVGRCETRGGQRRTRVVRRAATVDEQREWADRLGARGAAGHGVVVGLDLAQTSHERESGVTSHATSVPQSPTLPSYSYDHIHLRTRDPRGTADWYARNFGAKVISPCSPMASRRIDLDINGLTVFIAQVPTDAEMAQFHRRICTSGSTTSACASTNLDAAAAELKQRGVVFTTEPRTIRSGVKIAFVQCPDNVRVELLERS